jgi:hypothetical protein
LLPLFFRARWPNYQPSTGLERSPRQAEKRRQAAALHKKQELTMPITISLSPLNVDSSASNFVYAIGTLTFSGNYPTGGDTLDFTQVADKLPSTQIVQAFAESQNGNSGYYVVVAGTALNNFKLKAFNGGGTEVTAGAYPASITSDIVQLAITARKLL